MRSQGVHTDTDIHLRLSLSSLSLSPRRRSLSAIWSAGGVGWLRAAQAAEPHTTAAPHQEEGPANLNPAAQLFELPLPH